MQKSYSSDEWDSLSGLRRKGTFYRLEHTLTFEGDCNMGYIWVGGGCDDSGGRLGRYYRDSEDKVVWIMGDGRKYIIANENDEILAVIDFLTTYRTTKCMEV